MIRFFYSIGANCVLTLLFLVTLLLSWSCKKEDLPTPQRCCTKLKVLNLAERCSTVDIFAQYWNTSNKIISDFKPKTVFPRQGFLTMEGTDSISELNEGSKLHWQVVPKGHNPTKRSILADTVLEFKKDRNYLVFMSDRAKNEPVFTAISETRSAIKLDTGRVYFRVLELIPGRDNILLIELVTRTLTNDVNFGTVSEYSSFLATDQFYEYSFEAKFFTNQQTFVKSERIRLERGKSYTFYLYKDVNGLNKIGYFED